MTTFALTLVLVFVTRDARFILIKPSIYIELAACYILATTLGEAPLSWRMVRPFATDGKIPKKVAGLGGRLEGIRIVFAERIRMINALCRYCRIYPGRNRPENDHRPEQLPVGQAVLYANTCPFIVFILFCGLLRRFYLRGTTRQAMGHP